MQLRFGVRRFGTEGSCEIPESSAVRTYQGYLCVMYDYRTVRLRHMSLHVSANRCCLIAIDSAGPA